MAKGLEFFGKDDRDMEMLRVVGDGYQACKEWLGDKKPFRAGIAELSHIRIADYIHPCDDFLYVIDGSITISDESSSKTLKPGDAVFIPKGTLITMEVPETLLWIYATVAPPGDWGSVFNEPGSLSEM